MSSTETRSIPQQITLANILWFNRLLVEGWSYDDIDRRHSLFTNKVEYLLGKYTDLTDILFNLKESADTLEIMTFLSNSSIVERNDMVLCEYCVKYIEGEIKTLGQIESEMFDDSDIRTFSTVFNVRTIGYTKTFFKELVKVSKYNVFGSIEDITEAVKLVIPKNSEYHSLSDSTIDRRKTTVTYWNRLVMKVERSLYDLDA